MSTAAAFSSEPGDTREIVYQLSGVGKTYAMLEAGRKLAKRMLITEPAVLLLDEPFSALDELTRDFMNMELQRICASRDATAFLVTHSIPEAVILSDVVYVMRPRPGRIAEEVVIDLPRPRKLEMITTPKFGALVERIRGRLDKEAFI